MNEKTLEKRTILVCLSSSPSCQSIIKAANKAKKQEDRFLALYVGLKEKLNTDNSLQSNVDLVKSYGGEIHVLESNEIVLSIVEFAKRMGLPIYILALVRQVIPYLLRDQLENNLLPI